MKSVVAAVRMIGLVMAAGSLFAGTASAADSGIFQKLSGNWKCKRGGCWVKPVGAKVAERLGCRVNYGVSGSNLTQNINCKGSIQLNSTAKLTQKGNRVSGNFSSYNNHTGRMNGSASGIIAGSRMSVGISANDGQSGAMRTQLSGNSQTVELYQVRNGKRYKVGRLQLQR